MDLAQAIINPQTGFLMLLAKNDQLSACFQQPQLPDTPPSSCTHPVDPPQVRVSPGEIVWEWPHAIGPLWPRVDVPTGKIMDK